MIRNILILTILIFITSGCTTNKKFSIQQVNSNAMDILYVTNEHTGKRYKVLQSPHKINNYMITDDGVFIAYISNEYGKNELFVQRLRTGMRIRTMNINDVSGEFKSLHGNIIYISRKDNIKLSYSELNKKIK